MASNSYIIKMLMPRLEHSSHTSFLSISRFWGQFFLWVSSICLLMCSDRFQYRCTVTHVTMFVFSYCTLFLILSCFIIAVVRCLLLPGSAGWCLLQPIWWRCWDTALGWIGSGLRGLLFQPLRGANHGPLRQNTSAKESVGENRHLC